MIDFDHKHISDPVYKTIGLSELETEVIDTPIFQRLRRVKHLGLVSLVYPGADFSRFDHSLGVCHVTGRILSAIRKTTPNILDKDIQKYRLAALLHDIGHYPFSHPMEEAIEVFYEQLPPIEQKDTEEVNNDNDQEEIKFIDHEQVGEEILRLDSDLNTILRRYNYKPEEISEIFTGSIELPFGNLVKSDLDADRIDYLLRTAHHTGVPYGSIDVDYLISQMILDEEEDRISLHQRALRSAEHFLLGRYFVYQQNIFHKTVVGFEYLLRDISKALLEKQLIHFSKQDVENSIINRDWCHYDDVYIEGKIRDLKEKLSKDDILNQKIDSIQYRKPLSLVWEWEVLADRGSSELFEAKKQLVAGCKEKAIERFEIDETLWRVWDKRAAITNLASHKKITDERDDNELLKSVYLYDPNKPDEQSSQVIMDDERSLMSIMADKALYIIRVYVLLPVDKKDLKSEIREFFNQELS